MSDLGALIGQLSAKQRALLESRLRQRRISRSPVEIIARQEEAESFPVSFSQERLWFVDQLEPHTPYFNIPGAIRLEGALDVAVCRRALSEVIDRHEALRTVFAERGDRPVQIIRPPQGIPLPLLDLVGLGAERREAELRRLTASAARATFDLAQGPLIRCQLARLSEQEHALILVVHHIIADGWSVGLLFRELAILYRSVLRREPSPLPNLPIQFRDFAVWQRRRLTEDELERQLRFWKGQLTGAALVQRLPLDHQRPTVQSFRGTRRAFTLNAGLNRGLRRLSLDAGSTYFATALALYQLLLYSYSGRRHVVVSAPISYRNWSEIEGLIGFFANTLLFRTELSEELTFSELLAEVHTTVLNAQAHQDLPFERVVEALAPERSLSVNPLLQVAFNFFDRDPAETEVDTGLTSTPIELESGSSQYEWNLVLMAGAEDLRGYLEYRVDLFEDATIREVTSRLKRLAEQVVENPGVTVAALLENLRQQSEVRQRETKKRLDEASATRFTKRRRRALQVRLQ